jgi:hypothetical protein
MQHPESVFRNPAKLASAQQILKAEQATFLQVFGNDFVVIPGSEVTDRMLAFYRICRENAAEAPQLPFTAAEYPAELVNSERVAILHDEVEGLSSCAGFGPIESAFADPELLRQPEYRRRLREYLDDDTIPPQLFERVVARDPERGNQSR